MSVDYDVYSKQDYYFLNYRKDTLSIFDYEGQVAPIWVGSDKLYQEELEYLGRESIDITDEVYYHI